MLLLYIKKVTIINRLRRTGLSDCDVAMIKNPTQGYLRNTFKKSGFHLWPDRVVQRAFSFGNIIPAQAQKEQCLPLCVQHPGNGFQCVLPWLSLPRHQK